MGAMKNSGTQAGRRVTSQPNTTHIRNPHTHKEEAARSGGHSLRARAFSLRGVQELSLVSVLRTMLLAEAEEEEEGEKGETQQQQLPPGVDEEGLATIARYAREEEFAEGATIFYRDDPSDAFYLILLGEVALESAGDGVEGGGQRHQQQHQQQGLDVHWRGVERHDGDEEEGRVVEVVLHSGSLFGFVDFMLDGQRRRFYARAMTRVRLAVFSGRALKQLEREQPHLFIVVQKLLLKQFAIELGNVSAL